MTDAEKIIHLVQSDDISNVLMAFQLNDNFKLVPYLLEVDERMQEFKDRTLLIKPNSNQVIIKENGKEVDQKEAEDLRASLYLVNTNFLYYEFTEQFLMKRYGTNIVFVFS